MEFTPIVTPGTKHFSMDSASSRSRFGCSFFLPHTSSTSNMARNFRDMNMYDSLSKLDEFCHFFHCCNLWYKYFVNSKQKNISIEIIQLQFIWMWWGLHWFHVMWNGSRAAAQPTMWWLLRPFHDVKPPPITITFRKYITDFPLYRVKMGIQSNISIQAHLLSTTSDRLRKDVV